MFVVVPTERKATSFDHRRRKQMLTRRVIAGFQFKACFVCNVAAHERLIGLD